MSQILQKYLSKLGVKTHLDLNDEERATYHAWSNALSGRQLTSVDVKNFLDGELDDAVGKLTMSRLSDRDDTFLKMKVDFIRKVKVFLASPEVEKRVIQNQIESQL